MLADPSSLAAVSIRSLFLSDYSQVTSASPPVIAVCILTGWLLMEVLKGTSQVGRPWVFKLCLNWDSRVA